jgi:hypothetical protein
MPYTPNRRGVAGFVIVEPDGDRPYFCHKLPLEYLRQASARGGRVYAFELDFQAGVVPGTIREIALTRGKVLADLVHVMGTEPLANSALPPDVDGLHSVRLRALISAARDCRVVEAVDQRLFELDENRDPAIHSIISPDPAIATLPWRGSVTDLATDIRGELSEREVDALVAALSEPKRGGRAV